MKQKKIKTYKFVLIHKHNGDISFTNKLTVDQRYTHYRHRAKWFHIKSGKYENINRESYTNSELTFMIVDYYTDQVKEQLKCKRTWDNIKKITQLDNLKEYYYQNTLKQLADTRKQLKIWKKKKADVLASPEYMFELLRR
jgi:hypothetical protein